MQNNAGTITSPCCSALEQSILCLFPEFTLKNTAAVLSLAVRLDDERHHKQAPARG